MPYRSFDYVLDLGALGYQSVEVEYEPSDKPELLGVWSYNLREGHALNIADWLLPKVKNEILVAINREQEEGIYSKAGQSIQKYYDDCRDRGTGWVGD